MASCEKVFLIKCKSPVHAFQKHSNVCHGTTVAATFCLGTIDLQNQIISPVCVSYRCYSSDRLKSKEKKNNIMRF